MIDGLLRMSAVGAAVICAVLLLRLFLRRVPKIFSYALWLIVLFRLLCPVSVALPVSVFNLLPDGTHTAAPADIEDQLPERLHPENGQALLTEEGAPAAGMAGAGDPVVEETPASAHSFLGDAADVLRIGGISVRRGWRLYAGIVWLAGVLVMLGYACRSSMRMHKTLKGASLDRDNIYLLEDITSPFVAGVLRPRIYLPCGLEERECSYILLHEQTHIRRGDPLWRVLAYVALTVHWFNPFVWAAFFLSGRDMEMSCDETVLRRLGAKIRCDYSDSLLRVAQGNGLVSGIPLAFGEGDTKKRIKNVLNYQKTTIRVIVVGALVVLFALAALGADPVEKAGADDGTAANNDNVVEDVQAPPASDETAADKGEVLTMEQFCRIVDEGALEDTDFRAFANGSPSVAWGGEPNGCFTFPFTNELGDYELEVAYAQEGDALDAVYLTRIWDGHVLWIYSAPAEESGTKETVSGAEIEAFLTADFDILNEISFELPESLTMEPYQAGVGIEGGRLFSPDAYEGGESAPAQWKAAGMVSRYRQKDELGSDAVLLWEQGSIREVRTYSNHTVLDDMEPVDDLDAPAMIVSETHDLYTAPEMYDMDEANISYEATSSYWSLYIAREGETFGYVISLNRKNFSREDLLALAETVRFFSAADEENPEDDAVTTTVSVRTIARSARCIDSYVAPEGWEDAYGSELAFAQDCKFYINSSRDTMSPKEVTFSEFAEAVEAGDRMQNKPCVVKIHNDDRLIHEITLVSARYRNGVSYAPLVYDDVDSFHRIAAEYDAGEFKKQELVRTETMDLAAAGGDETMEIYYYKDRRDGCELGIVHFFDSAKKPLYSFAADNTGMCWKNIYVGRMDGAGDPYILELYLENRDTSGEYSYYVYTLGYGNDERIQIAGSRIEWKKDGSLVYDPDEMTIFFHELGHYLSDSHLLVGMEDGQIRTQPVCDKDRYTYKNCAPSCFPDPYEGLDIR